MSRLLALSLLFPGAALAAPLDWGLDGADAVEITGAVEVPLVRWTDGRPAVWATGPVEADKPAKAEFLLMVDLASGWTRLDEPTAKALGGKIAETTVFGVKQKVSVVPEIRIGALVLRDVRALILPGAPTLGAGTLDEVATAILPSDGVVKFVPAADAAALLAGVGAPVAVQRIPAEKWFEYGAKKYGSGLAVSVSGKMFGRDGQIRLRTADWATLTKFDPPAASRGYPLNGMPAGVDVLSLGPVESPAAMVVKDGGIADPADAIIGVAGWSTLHTFDLAFSPATDQLALRLATASKGVDPRAQELVVAKRDHDEATKPAPEGDEKKEESPAEVDPAAGTPAKPEAGAHAGLAAAYEAVGDDAAAIALWKQAVDVAGDDCSPYLGLGEALLASGDAAAALPHLQRAGELWERWIAQPENTRRLIGLDRAPEGAFTVSQSGECAGAWSDLARAQLALGAQPAVERVWTDHRAALDPALAHAYGVALIRAGKVAEAGGPLREAVNGGDRADPAVRAALALSVAKTDVNGALPALGLQVERIAALGGLSLSTLLPVVEAARAAGGDAAAADLARRALALRPLSPSAALLVWREAKKGGDAAAAAGVAQRNTARGAAMNPFAPESVAGAAFALALGGDVAGARAALDGTKAVSGDGFVASALVAEAAGDYERARAELAGAAKRGLLVIVAPETFTAPPPPPPAPEPPPLPPPPAPEPPKKKTR